MDKSMSIEDAKILIESMEKLARSSKNKFASISIKSADIGTIEELSCMVDPHVGSRFSLNGVKMRESEAIGILSMSYSI